jgi:hypothetical protein
VAAQWTIEDLHGVNDVVDDGTQAKANASSESWRSGLFHPEINPPALRPV